MTASRTPAGPTIGIDFGTTNTVIAVADSDGRTEALKFNCGGEVFRVYMSALCFWEERRDGALHTRVEGGPWAIEQFLERTSTHRFIQSFKTFAASRSFKETRIFRQRFEFEESLGGVLSHLVAQDASLFPIDLDPGGRWLMAYMRESVSLWTGAFAAEPPVLRLGTDDRAFRLERVDASMCATLERAIPDPTRPD